MAGRRPSGRRGRESAGSSRRRSRRAARLPVANAMNRSPEPLDAMPPDPREPEARPLGEPLALVGEERRVRREDDDDRARSPAGGATAPVRRGLVVPRARHLVDRDRLADRDAVDPQQSREP